MTFVNYPVRPLTETFTSDPVNPSGPKKCTKDTECESMTVNTATLKGRKCLNGVCSCPFSYGGNDCKTDTCGVKSKDGGCVDSTVGSCELQDDGSYKCSCVISRTGATCQLCSQATKNVSGLLCVHNNCVNETTACNSHGICYATQKDASCQCFPGYNGKHCEINACGVYVSSDNVIHYCQDYGICEYEELKLSDGSVSGVYSCNCFPGVSGDKCQTVANYSQQIVVFTVIVVVELIALIILLVILVLRIKKSRRARITDVEDPSIN